MPALSSFELRDREIKWVGRGNSKKTRVEEVFCGEDMIEQIVEREVKRIQSSQRPGKAESRTPTTDFNRGGRNKRQCWTCGSTAHIKKDYPETKQKANQEVVSEAVHVDNSE